MQTIRRPQENLFERRPVSFLWKEWQEQKTLLLWSPAIFAALCAASMAFTAITSGNVFWQISSISILKLFFMWCYVSAIFTGSMIFCQEVGKGTLLFLSSLPLKRVWIWQSKITVAFFNYLLTLAPVLGICTWVWGYMAVHPFGQLHPTSIDDLAESVVLILLGTVPVFVLSTIVSMLINRFIVALIISVIISVATTATVKVLNALLWAWTPELSPDAWLVVQYVLITSVSLYISFELFVHGESLKSSKKYAVLVRAGIFDAGFVLGTIFVVYWLFFR